MFCRLIYFTPSPFRCYHRWSVQIVPHEIPDFETDRAGSQLASASQRTNRVHYNEPPLIIERKDSNDDVKNDDNDDQDKNDVSAVSHDGSENLSTNSEVTGVHSPQSTGSRSSVHGKDGDSIKGHDYLSILESSSTTRPVRGKHIHYSKFIILFIYVLPFAELFPVVYDLCIWLWITVLI